MLSKYTIFCHVVDSGGISKTARDIRYSQSAVSQTVKNIEQELGLVLLNRGKEGISLTDDGIEMMPFIRAIAAAEDALERKKKEMQGLSGSLIRIGTFTSVSRTLLPIWMRDFKKLYPNVRFLLEQGEYTTIPAWIQEGAIDFGFANMDAVTGMAGKVLYRDDMCAVLPMNHPLAKKERVCLADLANESIILLEEGQFNVPLRAFAEQGLIPRVDYTVYDDYSIIAMVEAGLGISIMYQRVLEGYEDQVAVRPIRETLSRTVGLVWKQWNTMPIAARNFVNFILEQEY